VFGFSEFFGANHNFATPYSHEATHGFLVCILLVFALHRWLECPTVGRGAMAGFLFGLTIVLKPEIMLAAGLVTGAALVMGRVQNKRLPLPSAGAWLGGAIVPTTLFWIYFSGIFPWRQALTLTSQGWLNALSTSRFAHDPVQTSFLGFDRPLANFVGHARATLLAAAIIAGIAASAKLTGRIASLSVRILSGLAFAGGVAWLAWEKIDWLDSGHCVLGLAGSYLILQFVTIVRASRRGEDVSRPALRWLVAVLAAGLMARMLLNGRIYQFGFYQAALASILVPAVLIGELPERMRLGPSGRATLIALTALLFATGVARLAMRSQNLLGLKTYAVGKGADMFYAMPPRIEATGALVNRVSDELRQSPRGGTLLVLPEGEMINYLARLPSPVAPFFFFSAATSGNREQAIVDELDRHPPFWVVIVSRDLREYGISRYGENEEHGKLILDWVSSRNSPVASIGGDPLDVRQRGAIILRHKD
jgi:hypothetical protein